MGEDWMGRDRRGVERKGAVYSQKQQIHKGFIMEEINTVTLYPAWKQAVEVFTASGFADGDIVPHDWFWENLQIEKPKEDTPLKQAEKLKLEFIS